MPQGLGPIPWPTDVRDDLLCFYGTASDPFGAGVRLPGLALKSHCRADEGIGVAAAHSFYISMKTATTVRDVTDLSVRSGLRGCGALLCCFSVSAMAQWCGSTLVTDDSRLFTLSVDLRL